MFLKRVLLPFLLFAVYIGYAQHSLSANTDLTKLSQTFVFSNFENSLEAYALVSTNEDAINFMSVEYVNAKELGENLTLALFQKNRNGMEKTGRILTYIGVPLAIIGGIMVAGANELYYNCVNGNCEGDARGGFGIVALAAGVGLGTTGGILWIIGSKK